VLEAQLATDFRYGTDSESAVSSSAELIRWLGVMREISPELRIAVDAAVAADFGRIVFVRLHVEHPGGTFLGVPLPPEAHGAGWGSIEQLTVSSSTVHARWIGHQPAIALEPVADWVPPFPLERDMRTVSLLRHTIPPQVTVSRTIDREIGVVVMESGTVTLAAEDQLPQSADFPGTSLKARDRGHRPRTLEIGQPFAFGPSTELTIANLGNSPAILLMLTRSFPSVQSDGWRQQNVWFATAPGADPSGVTVEVLGTVDVPAPESERIAIGRVTLGSGETLTWQPAPAPVLVATERGTMNILHEGGTAFRWQKVSGGATSNAEPLPGDSALVEAGRESRWIAGPAGATAIVVFFAPASAP
jgi:hypothetical protein